MERELEWFFTQPRAFKRRPMVCHLFLWDVPFSAFSSSRRAWWEGGAFILSGEEHTVSGKCLLPLIVRLWSKMCHSILLQLNYSKVSEQRHVCAVLHYKGQNDGKLAKCSLCLCRELTGEPHPQGTIWHQTAHAPCDCYYFRRRQAVTSHFKTITFISSSYLGHCVSVAFPAGQPKDGFPAGGTKSFGTCGAAYP